MSQVPKFGFAALLAPSIVPFLFLALVGVSSEKLEGLNALAAFWIAVVSYAGFFAFGYPLAKLLDKRGVLSITTLLVSGLICGAMVGVLLGVAFGYFFGSYKAPTLQLLFTFGGLGGLVALAFGFLARIRWSKSSLQDS